MPKPGLAQLISVQEALAILDSAPVHPRTRKLPLDQAAGMRLAQSISSDSDYPPFDKALVDGYAIRMVDVARVPVDLHVIETVAAGKMGQRALGAGQAIAIMTGAPLPAGTDAVIPVEDTARTGDTVTLNESVKPGHGIARRGSDIAAGRKVLSHGVRLGPAQIAVAASVGAAVVSVFDPPVVSLLCTGDELIPIDRTPSGAQIRNSNGPMMHTLLERLGCKVNDLGVVGDDPAAIPSALQEGIKSDALFVIGGMSMGEHDYVPGLMRQLGLEIKIAKLRMKPGKPFVFATHAHGVVFGLPGNPVSAFVCAARLAARVLCRMAGSPAAPAVFDLELSVDLPANGPREFYQPAIRTGSTVKPLNWNGSADIYTLAIANALIVRPENAPARSAGKSVPILDLNAQFGLVE